MLEDAARAAQSIVTGDEPLPDELSGSEDHDFGDNPFEETRPGRDFVTIRLESEGGAPLARRPFRAIFADGSSRDGVLDEAGEATLRGIPKGAVQIALALTRPTRSSPSPTETREGAGLAHRPVRAGRLRCLAAASGPGPRVHLGSCSRARAVEASSEAPQAHDEPEEEPGLRFYVGSEEDPGSPARVGRLAADSFLGLHRDGRRGSNPCGALSASRTSLFRAYWASFGDLGRTPGSARAGARALVDDAGAWQKEAVFKNVHRVYLPTRVDHSAWLW